MGLARPCSCIPAQRRYMGVTGQNNTSYSTLGNFGASISLSGDTVLNRLPKSDIRKGLLVRLAQQKAQSDPNQVAEWITSWPDSPERYRTVEALIDSWPGQSLTDTCAFVEDLLAHGMTPDSDATDRLIERWYAQNPDEAYHWVYNKLPDGSIRDRTLQVLTEIRQNAQF